MPDPVPGYEFTTSPLFLLRVAGLSVADVESLGSPRSAGWADRVLDLEQRLADTSEKLAGALGDVVGTTEDKNLRRALLSVRRDVHNLRSPDPGALERVRPVLEPVLLDTLDSWLRARDDHQRARAEGTPVVADELTVARTRLHELGRDPRLRQGIQLAAPMMTTGLDAYLDTPPDLARPPKRHRGVERSLVNYVFRAAFKTSPFSSFTRLCLGEFTDGGEVLSLDADTTPFQDSVTVNLAILGSVAQAAMLSGDLRRVLPVVLTPGWSIDGDRVRYVRRQYGYHAVPTAPTVGILEETDFSLPRGQILDEVIDILRREPGMALDELTERLHTADPAQRPLDRLAAYTDRLLELGLVIAPDLRVDPGSPRPVADFAERLGSLRAPVAAEVREHVEAMSDCARRYGSADLTRRAELVAEAGWHACEAQRRAGRTRPDEPRTVFYEDNVAESVASADDGWWQAELVPQLERLSTVLPALDPLVLDRLMIKGYFRDRYGRGGSCADITSFAHDVQRACANWTASYARGGLIDADTENAPFARRELTALRDARGLLATALRDRSAAPVDEVTIDDGLLDRVAERLGGLRPGLLPAGFFLQLARREDGWLAALNLAYSGLGMSIGRFGYPLEHATGHPVAERLRQQAAGVRPDSAVFAEITGGYDATNLSWHPPIAPYQLVGPGEVSFRPPDERLPVDDLVLTDDPDADELRLYSRRLGVRVVPVYLSSLVPVALPDVQRTLLALSCATMPNLNLGGWLTGHRSGAVESCARVRYRDIVLRRRAWSVSPAGFPESDQQPDELLLRWRRWWRAHQLPTELFYSMPARGGGLQAHLAEKPRYVSADSVLSLLSFVHSTRSADAPVRMTEMVPRPHESWLADRQRYVSEVCVEITGVRQETA